MRRLMVLIIVSGGLTMIALAVLARLRRPEASWEPGLEFNPDFDLTPEEILADIRGEAPSV
jgi:hypothetical protein